MITAWKLPTGEYRLDGETYHARTRIKAAGGRWDGKHWTVTEEQREALGIMREMPVIVTGCCVAEEFSKVPESKSEPGTLVDEFCGRCDSQYTATVICSSVWDPEKGRYA